MSAPIPLPADPEPLITLAKAILTAHPRIAVSRGKLVEVVSDDGPPRVLPLRRNRLLGILEMDGGLRPKLGFRRAPAWLVGQLLESTTWPQVAPLSGVTDVPMLRPDGSLLSARGYDPATGIWHEPSFPVDLPEAPTLADARAAMQELEKLADHFPLLSRAHRSSFVAALLTPFAALDGPSPLFLLDSPTRGCGATEAADVIGLLVQGRTMTRLEPPVSARQFRRQLARLGTPEESLLLLDGSDELTCRAALETAVKDVRWLDGAAVGEQRRRLTWYARTVNSVLTRESADFVLPVRFLDSLDQGLGPVFQLPPDLEARVRKERARYVRAALTVLRAYAVAGRPAAPTALWPGFEAWTNTVAKAIVWTGREDPLVARRAHQASVVDDGTELRDVVMSLAQVLTPKVGLTSPQIVAALATSDRFAVQCREALTRLRGDDTLTPRVLGNFLSRHRGKCVEGYFIQSVGTAAAGYTRWTIERNPLVATPARFARTPKPWDEREADVRVAEGFREARFLSPTAPVEKVGDDRVESESRESGDVSGVDCVAAAGSTLTRRGDTSGASRVETGAAPPSPAEPGEGPSSAPVPGAPSPDAAGEGSPAPQGAMGPESSWPGG